jgi:hypothetical protein
VRGVAGRGVAARGVVGCALGVTPAEARGVWDLGVAATLGVAAALGVAALGVWDLGVDDRDT